MCVLARRNNFFLAILFLGYNKPNMKKNYRLVLIIGLIIIFLSLFSGLPERAENVIELIAGIILLLLALFERYFIKMGQVTSENSVFEESNVDPDKTKEEDYYSETESEENVIKQTSNIDEEEKAE